MAVEMKETTEIPEGMYEGAACPWPLSGPEMIREISKWYGLAHRSTGRIIDLRSVSRAKINIAEANLEGRMPERGDAETNAIYEKGLNGADRNHLNAMGTIIIDHTGNKIR